jgi:hypothetical protein
LHLSPLCLQFLQVQVLFKSADKAQYYAFYKS